MYNWEQPKIFNIRATGAHRGCCSGHPWERASRYTKVDDDLELDSFCSSYTWAHPHVCATTLQFVLESSCARLRVRTIVQGAYPFLSLTRLLPWICQAIHRHCPHSTSSIFPKSTRPGVVYTGLQLNLLLERTLAELQPTSLASEGRLS